jgi:hypothetical protein
MLQHWIFFWQGKSCPGTSVFAWRKELAQEIFSNLEESTGVKPYIFDVYQGREPDFFLNLFDGFFFVYKDKWLAKPHQEEKSGVKSSRMFQVRGTNNCAVSCAFEVDFSMKPLNASDSFVLFAEQNGSRNLYYWLNGDISLSQNASVLNIVGALNSALAPLNVSNASFEQVCKVIKPKFKQVSAYQIMIQSWPTTSKLRLFDCCLLGSGRFTAYEWFNFIQDDLVSDDAFVLATDDELFMWVGNFAPEILVNWTEEFAEEYASLQKSKPHITAIKQGAEPLEFTRHFFGWTWESKPQFEDPYQERYNRLSELGVIGRVLD